MRRLEGGCSVPIGVETVIENAGKKLGLKAVVVTVDGENAISGEGEVDLEAQDEDGKAEELGVRVAEGLLDRGAQKLLDAIRFEKEDHMEKGTDAIGNDDESEKTAVEILVPIVKELDTESQVNGEQ
jgi:hypothetical protein